MAAVKTFPRTVAIPEQSSHQYQVTLKTSAGVLVPAADISDIYLSLRDLTNDAIINSRSAVAVKNANGGTLVDGLFTMQFEDDDMQAVGALEYQPRRLTLDIRLASGGRATREVVFWIKSMQDIEAA